MAEVHVQSGGPPDPRDSTCPFCGCRYPAQKFTPDCGSSITTTYTSRSRACVEIERLRAALKSARRDMSGDLPSKGGTL